MIGRKPKSILLRVITIILAGLLGCLVWLVYPGEPSHSPAVSFRGSIALPAHGLLNVLDYMSIDDNQLYVNGTSSGSVSRVSLQGAALPNAGDVLTMNGRPETHGLVIDPASGMGFLTRSGRNTVDVFDPHTMSILQTIPVAEDPDGILFDPHSKLIYVGNGGAHVGTLIDPATRTVVGNIPFDGWPEAAAIDPQTQTLYQNIETADELALVNVGQRRVIRRIALDGCKGPTGMALDGPHRRLFVACSKNARLLVLDLDDLRPVATVRIGGGTDVIALDASLGRLYTAGSYGTMTIVQQRSPNDYKVLDNVRTHFGAHSLTVDSSTHRVYVGYASLLVAPRVAVFDASQ